jgi:hypothetical protein
MNVNYWYKEGKITFVAGTDLVNGTGTHWATAMARPMPGDALSIDNKEWFEVAAVISDTQLRVHGSFSVSKTNVSYTIKPVFSATSMSRLAAQVAQVLDSNLQVFRSMSEFFTAPNSVSMTDVFGRDHTSPSLKGIQTAVDTEVQRLAALRASIVVQANSQDLTPDTLLKKEAFGLGAHDKAVYLTGSVDSNTIPAGFWRVQSSNAGVKPAGLEQFSLIVCRYNSVDAMQIACTTSGDFFWRHSANGGWLSWQQGFGLTPGSGRNCPDCNTVLVSGFYEISNGVTLNSPGTGSGILIHVIRANGSPSVRASQIAVVGNRQFNRDNVNGVWTTWRAQLQLGEFGLGTSFRAAIAINGDSTPEAVFAACGSQGCNYTSNVVAITNGPGGNAFGTMEGYITSGNGYTYSWQRFRGVIGVPCWERHAQSATTWSAWKQITVTGDQGLGVASTPFLSGANADTLRTSGFYALGDTWTGSPVAGKSGNNQGYLQHYSWSASNYAMQVFYSLNSERMVKYRRLINNEWSGWADIIHSDNLNKQSSVTDATAGALMINGAWGLGEGADNVVSEVDLNTVDRTQFIQLRGAGSSNGPVDYGGTTISLSGCMLLHLQWGSSATAYQILWTTDKRRFERQKNGGVWDAQWRDVSAGIGLDISRDVNCDTLGYGGLYRAVLGTRPAPYSTSAWHIIDVHRSPSTAAQLAICDTARGNVQAMAFRTKTDGQPYSDWSLLYHPGNLLNIGTTPASARAALEIGKSVSLAVNSDLNNLPSVSGEFYANSPINGPGVYNGWVTQFYISADYIRQHYETVTNRDTWVRSKINGVWTPWVFRYQNSNIVGTVIQSGGLPAGAVFERGTNANGSYIRYADGTQECWFESGTFYGPSHGDFGATYSATLSWNFPAAFVSPPTTFYSSGQMDAALGPACWPIGAVKLSAGATTTTSDQAIYILFSQMGGYKAKLKGYAIGRWY